MIEEKLLSEQQQKSEMKTLGDFGFSADQIEKLNIFKKSIRDYHEELHLVSNKALEDLDTYIMDCAHLWQLIHLNPVIIDVGSGNGFPGIVLGIMGASGLLVDSHKKKAAFLTEMVQKLQLNFEVVDQSIRNIEYDNHYWVVARGFGPLHKCLDAAAKLWRSDVKGLFLKSDSIKLEIADARSKGWKFLHQIHERYMQGTLLEVRDVNHK